MKPTTIDRPLNLTASMLPSVNFHFWQPCNMQCKFCFAGFKDVRDERLPKGHLPKAQTFRIVELLAAFGYQKITFVGGEPLLCPWLNELIRHAKALGMTTMIVTNGSRLEEGFLDSVKHYLDWVTLSIDSANSDTLLKIGRAVAGKQVITQDRYLQLAAMVKARRIRLKVNTVVCADNWQENLVDMIAKIGPERWKLFQVMPVEGQNSGSVENLLITEDQFESFVKRNRQIEEFNVTICPEPNELMRASYVMIDPAGRFFDSTSGRHTYSRPILQVGVEAALKGVLVEVDRFEQRGGRYDWSRTTHAIK